MVFQKFGGGKSLNKRIKLWFKIILTFTFKNRNTKYIRKCAKMRNFENKKVTIKALFTGMTFL